METQKQIRSVDTERVWEDGRGESGKDIYIPYAK